MDASEYKPPLTGTQQFLFFAGVIMPAISVSVETTTHICAETFFDPIPSLWYLLLVVFVPIAQFHVWFAIRRGNAERLRLAGWLNSFALGISIFYSFVYVPVLPLAALTLLFIVGLLPLAPLLSLIAAIVMRHHLKQLSRKSTQKTFIMRKLGVLSALLIIAALIGAIELSATVTRYGMKLASYHSPPVRAEGIRFLRQFGSRDYLLRACYDRSGLASDIFGYFFTVKDPVTPAEAQQIYYRVTGEPFTSAPPPRRSTNFFLPEGRFNSDRDQGRGRITRGLSLANSKIDATADAEGGVAYMQWTLVFRNDSELQREARAEVQLPPGGVVSRLTLWVNGEAREAAFAGTTQVRETYQQVAIQQRRDPVLVTTSGRDRIMVQCFPVPSEGGEMKIRIGVTVPLVLEDPNHVQLLLPHFVDRNFTIRDSLNHSVWIESRAPMSSDSSLFMAGRSTPDNVTMGAMIPDGEISRAETAVKLTRTNVPTWSKDPFESSGFLIQQTVEESVPSYLNRIVLVVDTSAAMEDLSEQIATAVKSIPPGFDVKMVMADANGDDSNLASGVDAVANAIRTATYAGGADNVPALLRASDLASEKPGNNAIVWVHSPQLIEMYATEELRQRWERRPYGPLLYSLQTGSGPDVVIKKLDGIDELRSSMPRNSGLDHDLKTLFERLTGQSKTYRFVRTSRAISSVSIPSDAVQASDHLARLWAKDEVARILSAHDPSLHNAATILAVRYQIVTRVTGAVVLETAEQYRNAGLTPVDSGTVPTIPEPEMVVLLIVAGLFLMWLIYRKRRSVGVRGCPV